MCSFWPPPGQKTRPSVSGMGADESGRWLVSWSDASALLAVSWSSFCFQSPVGSIEDFSEVVSSIRAFSEWAFHRVDGLGNLQSLKFVITS